MSTYPRLFQRALSVEPPDRVLWAALRELLTIEEFAAVEAAYKAQSRRYQRASELNKLARWVRNNEHQLLNEKQAARLAERKAILDNPLAYINGEDQ
jgi:hypothetical protein